MIKIVYSEQHARSIASAALLRIKFPAAEVIELKELAKVKFKKTDTVHVLCDEAKVSTGNVVHSAKDDGKKKRVKSLFEKLFPVSTVPKVIHLLGGDKVREEDAENIEAIKAAICSELPMTLEGMDKWRLLIQAKSILAMSELISNGKTILKHMKSSGSKAVKKTEGQDPRVEVLESKLSDAEKEVSFLTKIPGDSYIIAKANASQLKKRPDDSVL